MGPAEAARKLGVNTELIKKWAYIFKEYLGESANPAKGISRYFSIDDIVKKGARRKKTWTMENFLSR